MLEDCEQCFSSACLRRPSGCRFVGGPDFFGDTCGSVLLDMLDSSWLEMESQRNKILFSR